MCWIIENFDESFGQEEAHDASPKYSPTSYNAWHSQLMFPRTTHDLQTVCFNYMMKPFAAIFARTSCL